ncbi:MAG: carbon-nitrogen hydrolase family protein [Lachnospiraceae bacterium]|nr:carbon-nitrogen hydrolase family protein [Lachnospiraceae bacterium]
MKIGAYQFEVSGNEEQNFARIREGIEKAVSNGVRLLLFPECAVTGYPPHCIGSSSEVRFDAVERIHDRIQALAEEHQIFLVVGTILEEDGKHYNAAMLFCPDGRRIPYRKRALWGWDRDNFSAGEDSGVVEIDSHKVGIRICFEVRFPEYFRELYKEQTDLNLILFFDRSEQEDPERYELIKGHIRTRAVENVCHILTCNTAAAHQTAPTGLYDRSGRTLIELERGTEDLLIFDFEPAPLDFGERGRKEISDLLMKTDGRQ